MISEAAGLRLRDELTMNRRTFIAALAGLPIVGKYFGAATVEVKPEYGYTYRYKFYNSQTGQESHPPDHGWSEVKQSEKRVLFKPSFTTQYHIE